MHPRKNPEREERASSLALGVCLIAVGPPRSLPTKMSLNIFPRAIDFLTAGGIRRGIHPAGRQHSQRRQEPASSASSSEAASSAAESGSEQSQPEVSDIPQDDGAAQNRGPDQRYGFHRAAGGRQRDKGIQRRVTGVLRHLLTTGASTKAPISPRTRAPLSKPLPAARLKKSTTTPCWEKTIIISHNGGYEAYYCGLGKPPW